jgi:hypothetical protein
MSERPPRVLRQIRRRALLADVFALVKIVIEDEFKKVDDDYEAFVDRFEGEISNIVDVPRRRVEVVSLHEVSIVTSPADSILQPSTLLWPFLCKFCHLVAFSTQSLSAMAMSCRGPAAEASSVRCSSSLCL